MRASMRTPCAVLSPLAPFISFRPGAAVPPVNLMLWGVRHFHLRLAVCTQSFVTPASPRRRGAGDWAWKARTRGGVQPSRHALARLLSGGYAVWVLHTARRRSGTSRIAVAACRARVAHRRAVSSAMGGARQPSVPLAAREFRDRSTLHRRRRADPSPPRRSRWLMRARLRAPLHPCPPSSPIEKACSCPCTRGILYKGSRLMRFTERDRRPCS